ncbi:MAG: hypothetical protein IJV14_10730 [Lachnospiraceae bacterium]|nr:hypothetical protein [Lachnospiraceae bacterium]
MKIVFDDDIKEAPVVEADSDEEEEIELEAEDIDEMEANQRIENVRSFTVDYIMQMMDADASCSPEEVGLEDDNLIDNILDGFEEILAAYGILCYRPLIVTDDDGKKSIAYSQYEDELGGY